MENFVIATNFEGCVEAFYIEEGVVMHTSQVEPENKILWSAPAVLSSNIPSVVRVEATANLRGQIQVVACIKEGAYLTCFQDGNAWSDWEEIQQQ